MKVGVQPVNVEVPFDRNEMFFSTTDIKGRIISGNQVFVRTSKYEKDEIIGKPHNIVRHPDMPKVIFKLLWDYIQSNRPIVAYVKNMAKDGSYYWVLATVVPISDSEGNPVKYLSIRIKPESKYFEIAKGLYKRLKEVEEKEGIEASLDYLQKSLKDLGFESYDHFMKVVLEEELRLKENVLNVEINRKFGTKNLLDEIYSVFLSFKEIQKIYNGIYLFIQEFKETGKVLRIKSKDIFSLADDIRLISLNSSVESYKLGSNGNSFFVLSTEMRKTAEKSSKVIKNMENCISKSLDKIDDITFSMSISKLGIFMINKFLDEVLCETCNTDSLNKSFLGDIKDNHYVVKTQLLKVYQLSKELNILFRDIINLLTRLKQLVKRLHFLYLSGMVESAHQIKTNFSIIFTQVNTLVDCTKKNIEELNGQLVKIYEGNRKLKIDIEYIFDIVKEVEDLLAKADIRFAS